MSRPGKRSDADYLRFGFYEGDRGGKERCHTKRIVYTRAAHTCLGNGRDEKHEIPKGTRVLLEKAIVDGVWCTNRLCVDCMDRWIDTVDPGFGIPMEAQR